MPCTSITISQPGLGVDSPLQLTQQMPWHHHNRKPTALKTIEVPKSVTEAGRERGQGMISHGSCQDCWRTDHLKSQASHSLVAHEHASLFVHFSAWSPSLSLSLIFFPYLFLYIFLFFLFLSLSLSFSISLCLSLSLSFDLSVFLRVSLLVVLDRLYRLLWPTTPEKRHWKRANWCRQPLQILWGRPLLLRLHWMINCRAFASVGGGSCHRDSTTIQFHCSLLCRRVLLCVSMFVSLGSGKLTCSNLKGCS